jgi:hypothetical protein
MGTAQEASQYGVAWPVPGRQYLFFLLYDAASGAYGVGDSIWVEGDVVVDMGNTPVPYATGTAPAAFMTAIASAADEQTPERSPVH